jgi:hypothetical protein
MRLKLVFAISIVAILLVATIYFAVWIFYLSPVHNVSVLYVDVNRDNIGAIVENEGNQVEEFNVTAYCNGTMIETKSVTALLPGAHKELNFTWDAASLPYGKYNVSVVASTVPGETNTTDNSLSRIVWTGVRANVLIIFAYIDTDNHIIAIARNDGDRAANFTVDASCNGTLIGTKTVTGLPKSNYRSLEFPWDIASLPHDKYNVSVVASTVPNETDTTDNSFSFLVETGLLWSAADYFNFTAISAEARNVGSGKIQMTSLQFNITAIRGDAHNVTICVEGMADSKGPFTIYNQTAQLVNIDFRIPYQSELENNSAYPVKMTISGKEINPQKQEVIISVPPLNGSSYTIWRGGENYYAKDDWSGMIPYYGSNFTLVFEQVLNALPQGGTVNLEPGYYEGWMVINRSGIVVQGRTVFCDNPDAMPNGTRKLPDDPPWHLMGTVLIVDVAGQDGIHLAGQLSGVQVNDLGIEFTQNVTGHGISDDMDDKYHLSYCKFENIMVLNHDRSHYAIQMSNFLHLDFKDIWAWGGPLLNLYGNMSDFQCGNSNFYNLYGYIKYDLAPVDFVLGPYPIFIHKNDSLSRVWVNLLHFIRIQINCPFAQSDPDFCEFTLWDCRLSTIVGLDLEGSGNGYEGNKLRMGSCYSNEFIEAFMWSKANNLYVNVASNNVGNNFESCWICAGTVLDSSPTDLWNNCIIDGTIHPDSQARFAYLAGNYGTATLPAGTSELNITAKFIGGYYLIILQSIPNATQNLRITAIYYAPSNTFTVACTDGQPASEDIDFTWCVMPP